MNILHSNYLLFCSSLPMKIAIFLKRSLLFNSFYCLLKTRAAMNAKMLAFVICFEAIAYVA